MIFPPLDELLKKADSKYTLVAIAAKRARELQQGEETTVNSKSNKMVTVALEEIAAGNITYERTKQSAK
ncbi:MAG: DNA-directed RNA polymerase subunit omega [bacterium]|jgi:DNA-directed RNA polymerase subunit omega